MEKPVRAYLKFLETADYEQLIQMFAQDATVHSPLYGRVAAKKFYRQLLEDTSESKITVLDFYFNPAKSKACVNFIYEWTLANGNRTSFDCVDLFEFDKEGKISRLKIIYDSQKTRPVI